MPRKPVPADELHAELKKPNRGRRRYLPPPAPCAALPTRGKAKSWDFGCVAIGESTAGALKNAGASCVYVSGGTGTAELLSAVIAAVENKALPAQGL